MPPVKRRSRTYDPGKVLAALTAQVEAVRAAATVLSAEQLILPSGLAGWDVHHLLAHIAAQIDEVPRLLTEPPPAASAPLVDLNTWAVSTAHLAERPHELTKRNAAAISDPAEAIATAAERLEPVLEDAVRTEWLLPHSLGAMRALDFTVTRLVELVVHSDDLARATGIKIRLDRTAVACVVRVLADALAAKAPGGSVEVRIPPFAVVQCGSGPRHTRGTPPNVVETGPITWIRIAAGRMTWDEALQTHQVTASGRRADLSAILPVLE